MVMTSLNLPTATLLEELIHELGPEEAKASLTIEALSAEEHGRSTLFHLQVGWKGVSGYPTRLVLKSARGNGREAAFYQTVRPAADGLPVIACFGARHDPAGDETLILLEDVSGSHASARDWPKPVPVQATREVVEALARFHASFWDPQSQAELGMDAVPRPDFLRSEADYQEYLQFLKRDLEVFTAGAGNSLSAADLRLFQSVLAYLPGLWQDVWQPRLESGKLAVIHGDLNPYNVLYPNHAGGKVYFADWEGWRIGLPTSDLAMLLGLHLCPDQAEAMTFLRYYHAGLLSHGVQGYSFDDLLGDYQIALLYELFYPLKLFSRQGIRDQAMLENAIEALQSFSDLID